MANKIRYLLLNPTLTSKLVKHVNYSEFYVFEQAILVYTRRG